MAQIGDDIFKRFKTRVECHAGLLIRDEEKELLRKAVTVRMKELDLLLPEEYLSLLSLDTEEGRQEWKALIVTLTTGESYFFRDKGHFSLLQNMVIPELIKKNRIQRSLRVWSAGCSTGEEPYSIAILLQMFLPELKGWDIVIIGTDINEEYLEKGRSGIYPDWSFRMLAKDIQNKYFNRRPDGWEINEFIKKMVTFRYGNLMEADFFAHNPELCSMDLIICRNVFIYFKKDAVAAVFGNFLNILNDGGYLLTGHGELFGHDLMGLQQIVCPEAVIYRNTAQADEKIPGERGVPEQARVKELFRVKEKQLGKSLLPAPQKKAEPRDLKLELEELISKGRYAEVMDKARRGLEENSENGDIVLLIAQACANSGDYEKAEFFCKKAMNCAPDSADPYFLLAHIAEVKGEDEEAKDLFKKAIYLNPAFIAAHCELGGLYEKQNDLVRAKKIRATAIDLLLSLPAQLSVKPYDMTVAELLAYIRNLQQGEG